MRSPFATNWCRLPEIGPSKPRLRKRRISSLRDIGFEVIEVTSAKAALDHAGKDAAGFKAVIVDIGLPDKKGDVLAAELRMLRSDLPIIVATGHSGDSLPKELREAANVAVLGKPYDLKDLKAALNSVGVAA